MIKNKYLVLNTFAGSLPILLTGLFNEAHQTAVLLVALMFSFLAFLRKEKPESISAEGLPIFWLFPIASTGLAYLTGDQGAWLDGHLALMVCGFVFVLLCQFEFDANWFAFFVLLASLSVGSIAIFQTYWLGQGGRISSHAYVIPYGMICATLAALNLPKIFSLNTTFLVRLAHLLSFAAASYACVRTGSRGPLLALVAVILIYSPMAFKLKTTLLIAVGILIGLFTASLLSPQFNGRINAAKNDLTLYFSGENRSTSIGLRFEMYRSAIDSAISSPLLGIGTDGYRNFRTEGVKSEEYASGTDRYGHAHSDTLHALATTGLVGLFALLTLYVWPLTIAFSHSSIWSDYLAISVLMLILCGLSDFVFRSSGTVAFFGYLIAFTMSNTLRARVESANLTVMSDISETSKYKESSLENEDQR